VIIASMTAKRDYHKVEHQTIRAPELLRSLIEAKAASTGNTPHRLMVDALWISVEGLRHEDLKDDPSLETLQKHLVAALLQAEQYQQLAIEINEKMMAKMSAKSGKKATTKKTAKKKAVKKKSSLKKSKNNK